MTSTTTTRPKRRRPDLPRQRKPPTPAQQLKAQIAAAVALTDAHLLCRLVGHAWHRIVPDRAPLFGRIVVWECDRCTSKRDDIVSSSDGGLLARSYRYVEGYKLKAADTDGERRGGRQLSAPALRLALLRRDDAVVE